MRRKYGIIGDDEKIWTACDTIAELNGREHVELVENFTWEESDFTDPETGINYIAAERLAAAFDALCDRTGMKRKTLAEICGKHITSFCKYTNGSVPVPRLVWDKVKEFELK